MSFDLIDRTLFHLHELEQRTTSPEELEAISTAKIAFQFMIRVGEIHGFEDFLESFNSDGLPRPLLSFSTRKEADTWLANHPAPPTRVVVAIGSDLYSVGFNRRRGLRVLVRIPTQRELDAGES